MEKTVYEDYKYCMQDTNNLYIGAKYTLNEIAFSEDVAFKFRKVTAESLMKGSDKDDTLETMLYYLAPDDFRVQVLKQMRARIKVNVIREKKHFLKGNVKEYVTELMTPAQLTAMAKEEKEALGMVISELRVNKLALLTV